MSHPTLALAALLIALPSATPAAAEAAPDPAELYGYQQVVLSAEIVQVSVAADEYDAELSPARMIRELAASRDQAAWARLVLYFGGWTITEDKITAITSWMQAENYVNTWWTRNNPLNNGWGTIGGSYRSGYATLVDAAREAAEAIRTLGGYAGILAALKADSSPGQIRSAIIWSSWASGHYHGGTGLPISNVRMVQAPDSAWGL